MFLLPFGCLFAVELITVRISATKVLRGDLCLGGVGAFEGVFCRHSDKTERVAVGAFG